MNVSETRMQAFLSTLIADMKYVNPATLETKGCGGSAEWDYERNVPALGKNSNVILASSPFAGRRCLAETMRGYLTLVSFQSRPGDRIFMLCGDCMLYVLRPKGIEYTLVCECYVHGLMDGEAMTMVEDGRAKLREIRIV